MMLQTFIQLFLTNCCKNVSSSQNPRVTIGVVHHIDYEHDIDVRLTTTTCPNAFSLHFELDNYGLII